MTGPSRPYAVEWVGPAKRALGRLPEKVATAAIEFIYGPLAEPRRVGRPLRFEFEGVHSAHRGDYRVLYTIEPRRRRVLILTIEHRADVYRAR